MLNSFNAEGDCMPFDLQTSPEGWKLNLVGRLGVQQARPLWDALQPAMAAKQIIRLQAEGLEEIDTSIIQILCRVGSRPGSLRMGDSSDRFLAALESRGLGTFFAHQTAEPESGIPQVPPEMKRTPKSKQKPGSKIHG
jgi:anti-anti-sigma regulatory factor